MVGGEDVFPEPGEGGIVIEVVGVVIAGLIVRMSKRSLPTERRASRERIPRVIGAWMGRISSFSS